MAGSVALLPKGRPARQNYMPVPDVAIEAVRLAVAMSKQTDRRVVRSLHAIEGGGRAMENITVI